MHPTTVLRRRGDGGVSVEQESMKEAISREPSPACPSPSHPKSPVFSLSHLSSPIYHALLFIHAMHGRKSPKNARQSSMVSASPRSCLMEERRGGEVVACRRQFQKGHPLEDEAKASHTSKILSLQQMHQNAR